MIKGIPIPGYRVLALIAGGVSSAGALIDNYVLHSVLGGSGPVTGALVYTLTGYWSALIIIPFWSQAAGKRVDPNYPGLHLRRVHWRTQRWAILAGAATTLTSIATFIGIGQVDPSIALPLSAVYMIYLTAFDGIRKTLPWRALAVPAALVILGVMATSVQRLGFAGAVSAPALVWILVVGQGTQAVAAVASKRGMKNTSHPASADCHQAADTGMVGMDAINFLAWRVAWAAAFATLLTPILLVVTHAVSTFFAGVAYAGLALAIWLPLRMTILFFSESARNRAYQGAPGAAEVALLAASRVLLAVPLTLAIGWIAPQAFGVLPTDPQVWGIRAIGGAFVFIGITVATLQRQRSLTTPPHGGQTRQEELFHEQATATC